jgi:hypothetical protein
VIKGGEGKQRWAWRIEYFDGLWSGCTFGTLKWRIAGQHISPNRLVVYRICDFSTRLTFEIPTKIVWTFRHLSLERENIGRKSAHTTLPYVFLAVESEITLCQSRAEGQRWLPFLSRLLHLLEQVAVYKLTYFSHFFFLFLNSGGMFCIVRAQTLFFSLVFFMCGGVVCRFSFRCRWSQSIDHR